MPDLPTNYQKMLDRYPDMMDALGNVALAAREAGPIDEKTAQLIQLGAAAAKRSEGAVHSHVRRARSAGASPEEIRQAVLLTMATVGYPDTAAAMCWVNDILDT
jgi:AhpD family alkylhydroperoxidase